MARSPKSLANLENGKDTQFNGETAAIAGRKGAIKSAETRRARKTLRTELELLLESYARDPKTGKQSEKTIQEAITLALITKALKGDTKAYEIIRDTIDQVEKMVMGDDK